MSESSGEKTELPTQKKLRDARKKGQVAKSQDVTSTVILIAVFVTIGATYHSAVEMLKSMFLKASDIINLPFDTALPVLGTELFHDALKILAPIIFFAVAAGILGNTLQAGFLISFESIKPDLKKLNPLEGFKRIFGSKNFFEFGKNVLKTTFLGIIVVFTLNWMFRQLLTLPYSGLQGIPVVLNHLLFNFCWLVAGVSATFAFADFFFQRYQHIKGLKMTKDEVKREYKESEGNPEIKGKRKQLAREIAMSDKVANTRKASVLITNPTHYAVAIHYDAIETGVPRVVAIGEGALAKKMVQAAQEEGVPIMRNVELAHALIEQTNEGNFIPETLWEPVSEVLKWAQEHRVQ